VIALAQVVDLAVSEDGTRKRASSIWLLRPARGLCVALEAPPASLTRAILFQGDLLGSGMERARSQTIHRRTDRLERL